jgi:hypothetical protein
LSSIAALVIIALIGTFGLSGGLLFDGEPPLRDAGALSPKHAAVVGEKNCIACHENHDGGPVQFIKAVFEQDASAAMASKCLDCHTFPEQATSVHKASGCSGCHSEHKGSNHQLIKFSDQQCHTCHETKFSDFASSHPQFGAKFPHRRRTAINFDHSAHLGTHFKDARYAEAVPEEGCISCHNVSAASKAVPVKSFEENCSGCHQEQIGSSTLALLTVPEFEKNPFEEDAVEENCREPADNEDGDANKGDEEANKEDEEYESVSTETLNPVVAALLDVDPENIEEYQEKMGELLSAMTESGTSPFSELIDEADGPSKDLLSGLNADLLRLGTCSWVSNEEFEPVDEGENGGWRVEELSVSYKATKHSDRVLKAWYDFAAEAEIDTLSDYLLKADGPGSCVSCHSVNDTGVVEIAWKSGASSSSAVHKFNHEPHLNVLGPGSQCGTCHVINGKAKYAEAFKQTDPSKFASGFESIKKETCSTCHNEEKVSQGCLTCHEYHEKAGFKDRMVFDKQRQTMSKLEN